MKLLNGLINSKEHSPSWEADTWLASQGIPNSMETKDSLAHSKAWWLKHYDVLITDKSSQFVWYHTIDTSIRHTGGIISCSTLES